MKSLMLATTSLNLSADTTAGEPDAQYRDESYTTPIPGKGMAGGVVPDVTPGKQPHTNQAPPSAGFFIAVMRTTQTGEH